ncbi:MAG: hypothetical protein AAFO17_15090 [Pseudomonadota bacterium]
MNQHNGTSGDDYVDHSHLIWGTEYIMSYGDDTVIGTSGDDRIYGDAGHDELFGGDGNDNIYGSQGDDILYGGAGVNTLDGGSGDDVLYTDDGRGRFKGGTGSDTFVLGTGATGSGPQVFDFTFDEDVIDLSEWGVTDIGDDLQIYRPTNCCGGLKGYLVIEHGDEYATIKLDTSILASDFEASDFIFA